MTLEQSIMAGLRGLTPGWHFTERQICEMILPEVERFINERMTEHSMNRDLATQISLLKLNETILRRSKNDENKSA
jgi:hypothetical protein